MKRTSLFPYVPSHPLFDRIFEVAISKWPTVDLGYIGRDEDGVIYLQQRGNTTPFTFHEDELGEEVA